MDISVVMSTRDRGARILPALQSVLATRDCNIEVIVTDQSTTDSTERALQEIGLLEDPRLLYQHSATVGLSRGRNEGIERAHGTVIAFTDDDCVVSPDWAPTLVNKFMELPTLTIHYAAVVAPKDHKPGWIPEYFPLVEGFIQMVPGTVVRSLGIGANVAVRRSVLAEMGLFDVFLGPGEDVDFGYRALRRGLKVYSAREPEVTHYGLRQGEDITALGSRYIYGMVMMSMKHVRCGDLAMLSPVAREFWKWFKEGTTHLLHGRRPSGYRQARAVLQAVFSSFRYRVDRRARLYTLRFKGSGSSE